jgi:ribonuclease HI
VESYNLCFDGCCKPKNPGGYAIGSFELWKGRNEELVGAEAELICKGEGATSNVAEWGGLVLGLRKLHETDSKCSVVIRGDSNLVVQQLQGRYQVKAGHLRPYFQEARKILEGKKWDVRWIPREQNESADQLGRVLYRELLREALKESRKDRIKRPKDASERHKGRKARKESLEAFVERMVRRTVEITS